MNTEAPAFEFYPEHKDRFYPSLHPPVSDRLKENP